MISMIYLSLHRGDFGFLIFLVLASADLLHDLPSTISKFQLAGYPEATWRNFKSVLKSYFTFCQTYKFRPFPASPDALNGFIVTTAARVKSPQTVSNYLPAIKTLHSIFGFSIESFSQTSHYV